MPSHLVSKRPDQAGTTYFLPIIETTALAINALLALLDPAMGAFPNFARHESSWFEALGFRMRTMPASRYLGAPRMMSTVAGWLGGDPSISFPVSLECNGSVLLKPFCPPSHATMEAAVRAFVTTKTWAPHVAAPPASAVDAVIAYCDYLYNSYGRFPVYTAPFRTVIGFQVCRPAPDFYARFYKGIPAALA